MSWWFNIVSFGQIHVYALIMYKINIPSTGIIITIIFIYNRRRNGWRACRECGGSWVLFINVWRKSVFDIYIHLIWYCFDNYFTYFVPVFK